MKKAILWISFIVLGVLALGVIIGGIKLYMKHQTQEEAQKLRAEELVADAKAEITELIEWNFVGVEEVTFGARDNGLKKFSEDDSLSTTPMGGVYISGWVNGDENLWFTVPLENVSDLNAQKIKLRGIVFSADLELQYKDSDVLLHKVSGYPEYWLTIEDIVALKERSYDKSISFEEIKQYFEEKVQ